jgi:hypothetical protein
MNEHLYAVTVNPNDEGDCFYGTLQQFDDCFGIEVHSLEGLQEAGVYLFGELAVAKKAKLN